MIFLNSLTLLQMDRSQLTAVYCNRLTGVKYHTSNDEFPRCKTCAKITTGKNSDELLQYDNDENLAGSGKFTKVENL